jgi:myo-inositol-1(or 4)-monophosphatase
LRVIDAPLADLAGHLERAVREAGALALSKFGSPMRNWTKGQNSPVSEADIAVDHLLHERLMGATPQYGWLSEESADDPGRLAAPRVWVVDPIDGTRGFIAGRPDWAVSAALVESGRPILGVLFAPVTDEMFVARAGEGATRNGTPMRAADGATLAGARIAGPPRRLERLAALAPGIETVPKIFSLALRLNAVAAETLDAAMAGPNSHDWDLAAADLLVHEAGGMLTDIDGRAPLYNEAHPVHRALFAAGPARHAVLLGLVRARQTDFA